MSLTDPFGLCPEGNGKIENLTSQMLSSASGMLSFMTEKPSVSWKDIGKAGLGLLWIGGRPGNFTPTVVCLCGSRRTGLECNRSHAPWAGRNRM